MATHSNILAWRIHMDRGAWRAAVHSFLSVYAQQWDCWIIGSSISSFLRNLHTVLHSGCTSLQNAFKVHIGPLSSYMIYSFIYIRVRHDSATKNSTECNSLTIVYWFLLVVGLSLDPYKFFWQLHYRILYKGSSFTTRVLFDPTNR